VFRFSAGRLHRQTSSQSCVSSWYGARDRGLDVGFTLVIGSQACSTCSLSSLSVRPNFPPLRCADFANGAASGYTSVKAPVTPVVNARSGRRPLTTQPADDPKAKRGRGKGRECCAAGAVECDC
jgi:hypothetical protein